MNPDAPEAPANGAQAENTLLHRLSLDHEIFDDEYRWTEDEENQESGNEQEAQADQADGQIGRRQLVY